MSLAARVLLGVLIALALFYIARWIVLERRARSCASSPGVVHPLVGFVTNFLLWAALALQLLRVA